MSCCSVALALRAAELSSRGLGPEPRLSPMMPPGLPLPSGDSQWPVYAVGGVKGGSFCGLGGRTTVFAAPAAPVTLVETSAFHLEKVPGAESFHCSAVIYEFVVILLSCAAASLVANDLAYLLRKLEADDGIVVAGEVVVDRTGEAKLLSMPPGAVALETSLASSAKSPSFCLKKRWRKALAVGVEETLLAAVDNACRALCKLTLGDVLVEYSPPSGIGELGAEENDEISIPVREEVMRRSLIVKARVRTVWTSSQT